MAFNTRRLTDADIEAITERLQERLTPMLRQAVVACHDSYLNKQDLASLLRRSVRTVERMRAENKLPPAIKIEGYASALWKRSEIMEHLDRINGNG